MEKRYSRRQSTKRRMRPLGYIILLLVLLLLVSLGSSLVHQIKKNQVEFGSATYGRLEDVYETEAILLRHEYVVTAPAGGIFALSVAEGERVSANALLGYMDTNPYSDSGTGKIAVYAPQAGIASTQLDGLEQALQPKHLKDMDIRTIPDIVENFDASQPDEDETAEASPAEAEGEDPVAAAAEGETESGAEPVQNGAEDGLQGSGEPICKLIDNLAGVYVYFLLPTGTLEGGEEEILGSRLSLGFGEEKQESGRVQGFVEDEAGQHVLLSILGSDVALGERVQTVRYVVASYSGYVIPASALVTNDAGETGVLIGQKQLATFFPVELVAQVGDLCAVEGIEATNRLILNPNRVKIGQRVYY